MKRGTNEKEEAPEDDGPETSGSKDAPGAAVEPEASGTPSGPGMSIFSRLRRGLRTFRFAIALVVLIVGTVLFFLGLFAYTPLATSGALSNLEQTLLGSNSVNCTSGACGPNWALPMILGGGLMALIGAYMAGVYIVARRRFEHLMKTKSKAEFLRNVTEAEDLLWDLTPEDEIRLVRKKLELKIRG